MQISSAKKSDYEQLEKLMPSLLSEFRNHGDVVSGSLCVAKNNGEIVGMGFLLSMGDKYLPEFETCTDSAELQIFATIEILFSLLETASRKHLPGYARVFAKEEHEAYREFLREEIGFSENRRMYRMEAETSVLAGAGSASGAEAAESNYDAEIGLTRHLRTVSPEEFAAAAKPCFSDGISLSDIRYHCDFCGGELFVLCEGEEILSGMLVYPTKDCMATEFIFTTEERRREGLAKEMIGEVAKVLFGRGCAKVMLHVFEENTVAIRLYESLGYTYAGAHIEMIL